MVIPVCMCSLHTMCMQTYVYIYRICTGVCKFTGCYYHLGVPKQ